MAAIVFIHGAGDSSAVWERQTQAFSKDHQVLAVDLPGHGARLAETGFDTHEQNAREACRIMDQRGIKKAIVAGHSMGGAVALTMALNHPDRVQGLVLMATGARMKMRPDFIEQARETAAKYGNTKPGATHIIPVEQMVHFSMSPEIVQWLKDKTGGASAQATYADFQANNGFDVMSRLPEINVPTLVVSGSDDRMAPQKFAEFLANAIKGAKLDVLTPSGHYPQVEQEEAFNRSFVEFIAATVPASAAV
jgi:pimeloyl-ACP methyl ester carboxylesterase